MKYADGPRAEVEIVVDAPVDRVWKLVTDINLPAQFSTAFIGADWVDERREAGASFIGRNHHPAMGEWHTTSWVNRYERQKVFGWAVSDVENPSATWWFELDDLGGAVRLRYGFRMGPAPSGLNIAIQAMPEKEERIIARRLEEHERNMRATLEGIKQLAESDR